MPAGSSAGSRTARYGAAKKNAMKERQTLLASVAKKCFYSYRMAPPPQPNVPSYEHPGNRPYGSCARPPCTFRAWQERLKRSKREGTVTTQRGISGALSKVQPKKEKWRDLSLPVVTTLVVSLKASRWELYASPTLRANGSTRLHVLRNLCCMK